MPATGGSLRRDPLSVHYDGWARQLLEQLRADPWNWHARQVDTDPADTRATDAAGLTHNERAAQRSLYWCLAHAATSGLRIRPAWSLQIAWAPPAYLEPPPGRILRPRRRMLSARLTPRAAGQRAVLLRGRGSYLAAPTSRGARPGEDWKPRT